eukprot:gene23409-biopygen8609
MSRGGCSRPESSWNFATGNSKTCGGVLRRGPP